MKRDIRTVSPYEFREGRGKGLRYIEDGDIIEIEEGAEASEQHNQYKAMEHIEKIAYMSNITKVEIKPRHRYLVVKGDTITSDHSPYGSTINRYLDKIEIPKEYRTSSQIDILFWITAFVMFVPSITLIMLGFYGWLILAFIVSAIGLIFWFNSLNERLMDRLNRAEAKMIKRRKEIEPRVENIIHFETHDIDKARKVSRVMSLAHLEYTLYKDA